MLVAGALQAAPVTVMPGLTYYDGSEKLSGKLVFLLQHDYQVESNSETAASIYEFDLTTKVLHEITKAPRGFFHSSTNGELFFVNYWSGIYQHDYNFHIDNQTKIFVYSKTTKESKIVKLKSAPVRSIVIGNRIVNQLDDVGSTNIVEYDAATGKTSQLASIPSDEQDNGRCYNGDAIGFKGQYYPIEPEGCTLINDSGKILHRFSWLHTLFSGNGTEYTVSQLSPDRHYAVVRLETALKRKFIRDPDLPSGSGNTYYLVDVSTGKTRVLIQDELEAKSSASLCGIQWVQ